MTTITMYDFDKKEVEGEDDRKIVSCPNSPVNI
jgi:hypothetical protein